MTRPQRIIYLPLESYRERYTEYNSCMNGVYETCFNELGIPFVAIRPHAGIMTIKSGVVLDIQARTEWGFYQVSTVIGMVLRGEVNPETDVIFIEDFWLPGFEMLPYTLHLMMCPVQIYSFCHAQTVDPNDFTYSMRKWMRHMERGWNLAQARVFCAAKEMVSMFNKAHITPTPMPVGHAFHAKTMLRIAQMSPPDVKRGRERAVVFASRWDEEKNPWFLIQVARRVKLQNNVRFIVASGADKIRSNDPKLLEDLRIAVSDGTLEVQTGLSKHDYYQLLQDSKVLFNCSSQDFISYTVLDAALNGCAVLCPNYLTFPDVLEHNAKHLYGTPKAPLNEKEAVAKLLALLNAPPQDYSWIYSKYGDSVKRMCIEMGFEV